MSVYVEIPGKGFRIPAVREVMRETCEFVRYQDTKLWYRIRYRTDAFPEHPLVRSGARVVESWIWEFPIQLNGQETSGAFEAEMKAVTLIRWIRRHIEFLTSARAAEDGA